MKPTTPKFIATASGKKFHLPTPYPDDICIEDIATGLSRQTRYNGQYRAELRKNIYSVAQHSCYVCETLLRLGQPQAALWGLLHDAAEAYLGDVPTPLKVLIPRFSEIEQVTQSIIIDKFSVPFSNEISMQVHDIDRAVLHAEVSLLGTMPMGEYGVVGDPPYPMHMIDPIFKLWTPERAAEQFLYLFKSNSYNIH